MEERVRGEEVLWGTSNNQHRTSNIQFSARVSLDVGCWMFYKFPLSPYPLPALRCGEREFAACRQTISFQQSFTLPVSARVSNPPSNTVVLAEKRDVVRNWLCYRNERGSTIMDSLIDRLRRMMAQHGLRGTASMCRYQLVGLLRPATRKIKAERRKVDAAFDRQNGVETAG